MHVLIVKTSSLGDIIHALPALTDAANAIPGIRFDWVIEENFAEIPSWHPSVKKIIPVAIRRWRKEIYKTLKTKALQHFTKELRSESYDLVIDAQGLTKSAIVAKLARGSRCGVNSASARDPLASLFYNRTFSISLHQHAILRMRQLFAYSLNYELPTSIPDYGIDRLQFSDDNNKENYVVFLHGTTWDTKHWPENYWISLAKQLTQTGTHIHIPWGNEIEHARAQRIAAVSPLIKVLPRSNLCQLAHELANAKAAVAVDTGLGHLAAALNIPTISLYGPTDPSQIGTQGKNQIHLAAKFSCAPCRSKVCTYQGTRTVEPACFSTITPENVLSILQGILVEG